MKTIHNESFLIMLELIANPVYFLLLYSVDVRVKHYVRNILRNPDSIPIEVSTYTQTY